MFSKAPFTSLMGNLKHNISFKGSYLKFGHRLEIPLQNLPEESSSKNR